MKKRIAIIDDEKHAREVLKYMLENFCPQVEICGEAESVEGAYKLIRQTQPDAILLDISMEDGTGFDLLIKFPTPSFQVIFTTAHDEFALKAFRFHALDYLLKPINNVDLSAAIDRLIAVPSKEYELKINNLLESAKTQKIGKMALTSLEGLVFVSIDQIIYLKSEGSYTTFFLLNDRHHLVVRPMKDFEELLAQDDFFKLHQSYIVNLSFVNKMLREDGGYVLMEGGDKIPIARRRKDDLLMILKNRVRM